MSRLKITQFKLLYTVYEAWGESLYCVLEITEHHFVDGAQTKFSEQC